MSHMRPAVKPKLPPRLNGPAVTRPMLTLAAAWPVKATRATEKKVLLTSARTRGTDKIRKNSCICFWRAALAAAVVIFSPM